jgi:hypothetical protein
MTMTIYLVVDNSTYPMDVDSIYKTRELAQKRVNQLQLEWEVLAYKVKDK